MAAPLPLAAGLDWLEGILPLLFLLFWIVSQVRNLFRGADGGKAAGPMPQRPARRPEARPPEVDAAREELSRQIEEFVRRSSGARPAAPPAGRRGDRPPPRGPVPPPAPPASGDKPHRRSAAPAAQPPAGLGSLGGHATDVARHVSAAFSREIEHLPGGGAEPAPAAAPHTVAADLVAALRDPATLRQLVIVREVLERPIERW